MLYLSQANLLKHLEGAGLIQPIQESGQNSKVRHFTSRVTEVFERALFESQLTQFEKKDIGTAYIDYLQEMAVNVT